MKPSNWVEPAEYLRSLPKKHIGSGLVLRNSQGKVLLVKATYKDYWTLPGGAVDELESPAHTCEREIFEELHLKVQVRKFLSINYLSQTESKPESLQMIFDGGVLTQDDVKQIVLDHEEIEKFDFFAAGDFARQTGEDRARVLLLSIQAGDQGKAFFFENSQLPLGSY